MTSRAVTTVTYDAVSDIGLVANSSGDMEDTAHAASNASKFQTWVDHEVTTMNSSAIACTVTFPAGVFYIGQGVDTNSGVTNTTSNIHIGPLSNLSSSLTLKGAGDGIVHDYTNPTGYPLNSTTQIPYAQSTTGATTLVFTGPFTITGTSSYTAWLIGIFAQNASNITVENFCLRRPDTFTGPTVTTAHGSYTPSQPQAGVWTTQGIVNSINLTDPNNGNNPSITVTISSGMPDPISLYYDYASTGNERTLMPFLVSPIVSEPAGSRLVDPSLTNPELDPRANKIELNDVVPGSGSNQFVFYCEGGSNHLPAIQELQTILAAHPTSTYVGFKAKAGANMIQIACAPPPYTPAVNETIRGVRFCNFSLNPVQIMQVGNALVQNVTINRPDPLWLDGSTSAFGGNTPFFSGPDGIQLELGANGGVVNGCLVQACEDDGIAIVNNTNKTLSGFQVTNSTVMDNQARGIIVTASTGSASNYNVISNNYLIRNNYWSIAAAAAGTNASVNYWNIFDNQIFQPGVEPAIAVENTTETSNPPDQHSYINVYQNQIWEASYGWNAIEIDSAHNITANDNVIESFVPSTAFESAYVLPIYGTSLVYVDPAYAVSVTGTGNMCLADTGTTQSVVVCSAPSSSVLFSNAPDTACSSLVPFPVPALFNADSTDDGLIGESAAHPGTGGTTISNRTNIYGLVIGYSSTGLADRSVLSFNTGVNLPHTAVPVSGTVQLTGKAAGDISGFTSVEVDKSTSTDSCFSDSPALQSTDFQDASTAVAATILPAGFPGTTPSTITFSLNAGALPGTMPSIWQLRMEAIYGTLISGETNTLNFYPGEAGTPNAPVLQLTYR
jgi:hypothetical protein